MSLPRTGFDARRAHLPCTKTNGRGQRTHHWPPRLRNLSAFHGAPKPHVRKHCSGPVQHICGVTCTFHHANLLSNVERHRVQRIKGTRYRRVRGYLEKIKDYTATLAKMFHPVFYPTVKLSGVGVSIAIVSWNLALPCLKTNPRQLRSTRERLVLRRGWGE